MTQATADFPRYFSGGGDIYTDDGELYAQLPESARDLSRCELLVLIGYAHVLDGNVQTDARVEDLKPHVGLSRRRISEGKRRLAKRGGWFKFIRQGGRSIATYLKRIRGRRRPKPDRKPKVERKGKAQQPNASPDQNRNGPPSDSAGRILGNLEAQGWRLELTGEDDPPFRPVKTQPDASPLSRELWGAAIAYKSAIVELLAARRPARE